MFRRPIFWVLLVGGGIHIAIPLFNHYAFRTVAYDYAVYNFAFYDFAHFRVSPNTIYQIPYPVTFLQDHFSLLLPLLSPLYWIMAPLAGTYSLLIIQWLFVMAGAICTYELILSLRGSTLLACAAVCTYFMVFGRFAAHRTDCNLNIMAAALVPCLLLAFESNRLGAFAVLFTVLAVTREDVPLWLFFICCFLAVRHRANRLLRNRAIIFAAVSVVFFAIVMWVLIPVFLEDENKKYSNFDYQALGGSPAAAIRFIFTRPLEALKLLFTNHAEGYFDNVKAEFYVVYLLSGGALLLLRPAYLIPFIPLIAKKMYNDSPIRWSTESYYTIEVATLLPLAVFMIIASFKFPTVRNILAIVVPIAAAGVTAYKILVPPVNPIVGESNKYNVLKHSYYKRDINTREMQMLLSMIPHSAPVSAGNRIVPHLAFRDKAYFFPYVADAVWILTLKSGDTFPLMPDEFDAALAQYRNSPEWKVKAENRDAILLQKVVPE